MSADTSLAASLIEAGAGGYAAAAASQLVDTRPEVEKHFGRRAFRIWKEHLTLRLRELAAALLVEERDLFVADVVWSRASFEARDMSVEMLRASLEAVSEVLAEELTEDLRGEPLAYLKEAFEALGEEAAGSLNGGLDLDPAEERLTLVYMEAALSGERRKAIGALLAAVDEGMPAADVYRRVLLTAQRRVGDMWHRWEVSVPQEHFVTATTQLAMSLLAHRLETQPENGKTAVVSVVPGNGHEVSAQALADFFDTGGWRSIFLGGQMPADDLVLGVEVFEADILALSLALSTHIRSAIEVVRKVRSRCPETKILLGGGVLTRAPKLWRKLGGDGSAASYEEALSLAAELTA